MENMIDVKNLKNNFIICTIKAITEVLNTHPKYLSDF